MLEEIKNSVELHKVFCNPEAGRKYLEYHRWNNIPTCPKCLQSNYYNLKSEKQPYYCKSCRRNFSVISGTIFSNSKVPLHLWFIGIWHVLTSKNSAFSTNDLAKEIGVTKASAWFMMQRIRSLLKDDDNEIYTGTVQMDEVYIGPDKNKMSKKRRELAPKGSGSVGKIPIIGIYNTETGKIKYQIAITGANVDAVSEMLDKHVSKDAVLVTDASPLYVACGAKQRKHISLNHKRRQFGEDGYHSNGIEGSFKHLRDKLKSTHKGRISRRHLQRYIDEFVYKKNKNREMLDYNKNKKAGKELKHPVLLNVSAIEGGLPYRELVKNRD